VACDDPNDYSGFDDRDGGFDVAQIQPHSWQRQYVTKTLSIVFWTSGDLHFTHGGGTALPVAGGMSVRKSSEATLTDSDSAAIRNSL